MSITIHVKNMAGDMTTLTVPPATKVDDVPSHLSELDHYLFPHFRTTVMRMLGEEEAKEVLETGLSDGDVLVSFVSETVAVQSSIDVTGNDNIIAGWSERLVFPIDSHSTLYLYPRFRGAGASNGLHVRLIQPALELVHPTFTRFGDTLFLSRTLRDLVDGITTPQIKAIYDIVTDFYRTHHPYEDFLLEWAPEEPYECECGSTIKRTSIPSHLKTKKHQAYLRALNQ
jgi:hypothetical protein